MAILHIVHEDDEVLRKTSREVTEITPRILTLLDDMADTLHKAQGVGLAAVQVGVLRRVVLVETEPGQLYELINPRIVEAEGEQKEVEGCLSLARGMGLYPQTPEGHGGSAEPEGEKLRIQGEGLLARAFCHEIDHLDGVLFKDNAYSYAFRKGKRGVFREVNRTDRE